MSGDTSQEYIKGFKSAIDNMIDNKIKNEGISKYISAIVSSTNLDGTINVYLPPDNTNIVSNLLNKTVEVLQAGDSVEICSKNGKLTNAWVSLKHGTNVSGGGGGGTGKEIISEDESITNIVEILKADYDALSDAERAGNTYFVTDEVDYGTDMATAILTGWQSAQETWTFSSTDNLNGNISISGNVTTKYSRGMKIKFDNNGHTIYGFITKLVYSSSNTILTFMYEINPSTNIALYLMVSGSIYNNYFSNVKAPYGFPLSDSSWSVFLSSNSTTMGVSTVLVQTPFYLLVPIGCFKLRYLISISALGLGGTILLVKTALSTGNNSTPNYESYDYRDSGNGYGTITKNVGIYKGECFVDNATSQNFYILAAYANTNGNNGISAYSESIPTLIRATCTYL